MRLWNVRTHRYAVRLLGGGPKFALSADAYRVVFSPDGRIVATVGVDFTRFWNARTGRQILPALGSSRVDREVTALAFSPDGKTFATGGEAGSVTVWSTATHRPALAPFVAYPSPFEKVTFSRDGRVLAASTADAVTSGMRGRVRRSARRSPPERVARSREWRSSATGPHSRPPVTRCGFGVPPPGRSSGRRSRRGAGAVPDCSSTPTGSSRARTGRCSRRSAATWHRSGIPRRTRRSGRRSRSPKTSTSTPSRSVRTGIRLRPVSESTARSFASGTRGRRTRSALRSAKSSTPTPTPRLP